MYKYIKYDLDKSKGLEGGFYDNRHISSFNCNITMVIGARRIGKTYSFKKQVIKKFLNKGEKFAWLRDNDEARKKLASNNGQKFFSDCKKMGLPKFDGIINGETIIINKKTAGYLMPSSTFQNYKGNDFEEIKTIVFDEFIAERNKKHNANRAWEIINMIYTICSTRKDVKIIFLANALDRGDPFLDLIGLEIKEYGFYLNREKSIVLHYCDNHPDFNKQREESVMGKIIKGTAFEGNLFESKFGDEDEEYFTKLPGKSKVLCILHFDSMALRLYYHHDSPYIYVKKDFNTDTYPNLRFVLKPEYVTRSLSLIPDTYKNYLKGVMGKNLYKYQNGGTKSIFISFFKNL